MELIRAWQSGANLFSTNQQVGGYGWPAKTSEFLLS